MTNIKQVTTNMIPISLSWGKTWKVYRIELVGGEWHSSYYPKIVVFRRQFYSDYNLLESSGRYLIVIPLRDGDEEFHTQLEQEMSEALDIEVSLEDVDIEELKSSRQYVSLLLNTMGGYIAYILEKKYNFIKIASTGNIGRFYHQKLSKIKEFIEERGIEKGSKLEMAQSYNFSLALNQDEGKYYMSVDLKTVVLGKELLTNLIHRKEKTKSKISEWKQDQREWTLDFQGKTAEEMKSLFKKFRKRVFVLQEYVSKNEGMNKKLGLLNYDEFENITVGDFLRKYDITLRSECKVGQFAIKGRANRQYSLPTDWFSHNMPNSSVKGRSWENEFHRFSKPRSNERFSQIQDVANFLNKGKQMGTIHLSQKHPLDIKYVPLKAGNTRAREFGRIPDLTKSGVEEWGKLRTVIICHSKRRMDDANHLHKILKSLLEEFLRNTSGGNFDIHIENKLLTKREVKEFAYTVDGDPAGKLYLVLGDKELQYRAIKQSFTQRMQKPVQYVAQRTRLNHATVKTMIPQILAKCGGLPYKLAENKLDHTLLIGLDKARDSSSNRASASAGVAAVTPEGRYVSGVSTNIDKTMDDAIDIDLLAPQLLENLEIDYPDLKYIVILRDGSPGVCKPEVTRWKHYLQEKNIGFAFLSSRKENNFRVFSSEILKNPRARLNLPVVLEGGALQANEFLTLTANAFQGTPKPVVYTLMENTTPIQETSDIINRVISQVVSMTMLSWESPLPTSQPLPLHYADKLAAFTQMVSESWPENNPYPMFI